MKRPRITSRQNPRVKQAVQLRKHKWRVRRQRIIIDGIREINRALDAGVQCVEAFICQEFYGATEPSRLVDRLEAGGAEVWPVDSDVFSKLVYGDRGDEVVAIAKSPNVSISTLQLPPDPLVAVLDRIEKPGNLGAILRSADATGVDAVINAAGRTDLFNPNAIRASVGTVFRSNVTNATLEETRRIMEHLGMRLVTASPEAATSVFHVDLRGPLALVLGNEAEGLSSTWKDVPTESVRLPMRGMADSLNVSATAAVLFYEALRQRSAATT